MKQFFEKYGSSLCELSSALGWLGGFFCVVGFFTLSDCYSAILDGPVSDEVIAGALMVVGLWCLANCISFLVDAFFDFVKACRSKPAPAPGGDE